MRGFVSTGGVSQRGVEGELLLVHPREPIERGSSQHYTLSRDDYDDYDLCEKATTTTVMSSTMPSSSCTHRVCASDTNFEAASSQ